MFDVGAQELILVGIIAFIVIGPERMPRLFRTAGLWFGRARRALLTVKAEIDQELKTEELREIMRKQTINRPLDTLLEQPPSVTINPTTVSRDKSITTNESSSPPRAE